MWIILIVHPVTNDAIGGWGTFDSKAEAEAWVKQHLVGDEPLKYIKLHWK